MNKRNIITALSIFAIFLFMGVRSAWIFREVQNDISLDVPPTQIESEAAKVVIKYWELSTKGNSSVQTLFTETPENFEYFSDPCKPARLENLDTKASPNDKTIVLSGRGTTSTVINGNRLFLQNFTLNIKERNYKILQIVEQREKGDEALVRVGYGNDESPWNQYNFLLRKQNNEWKIFSVMGSWQLEKINNYFAKEVDCK